MNNKRVEQIDKEIKTMKKIRFSHLFFNLILLGIIIFCLVKIGIWFYDNYKSSKVKKNYKDVQEKIDNTNIDKIKKEEINIKELKNQNSDTVGWLKVNNTDISYPIVKTNDNEYYMNRSFDKSYNSAGWPFIDYKNKLDGTDKNIVIYGHNRRNGDMFGTLKKTLREEWYTNKENHEILFITEKEKQKYQVYAVYEVPNEDYYINTELDDTSYSEFLNKVSSRSYYNFNVNLDTSRPTITLSTCSGNDKYRTVLHAIKKTN